MVLSPPKFWVFLFLVGCLIRSAFAADSQAPSVAVVQPAAGATLSRWCTVAVTAMDPSGVTNVLLGVDGATIGTPLHASPFDFGVHTTTLANGMHTLHAVATDGAGNTTRSPPISINVTNDLRYELGSGPFVIENLGSPLSANTIERPVFFQSSNQTHLLLYYLADYGENPLQVCDVNLSQGTARLTNGVLGRPGVYSTILYPSNNRIYLASGEANGKGYFMEYNPLSGAVRQIAQISDVGGYFSEIGDDGWIYIGQDVDAHVDRYHPNTDAYERLGSLDLYGSSGYAYTLGADSRYLYVGLGQDPWMLCVYDTQTANATYYWATNHDSLGFVRHGTNGWWYYYRRDAAMSVTWYQLTNGTPVLLSGAPSGLFPQQQRGNVIDGVNYGYMMGYEIDLADAYPNSFLNAATIRFRRVGETNWDAVSVTNFHLSGVGIQRLFAWPYDTAKLLGFSTFYQPVFLWDVNSQQITVLGLPQFNLYDAVFDAGEAYFAGYASGTLRYKPPLPWTLTGSTTNRFDSGINPYQISLTIGKHMFYETFGSDGLVYIGARHERSSSGGELGWYDPITGTNGSLRTPFLEHDINDLKPALGGTKLVYASTTSNLFVFDVSTKALTLTNAPLGTNALDKIIEVAPGMIFGATGSNIFLLNINNGSLVYSKQLPGKAFAESIAAYNHRLSLGPDGHVWMFVWFRDSGYLMHSDLYRINPQNGSYTSAGLSGYSYYTHGENSPLFHGGDLYLYGKSLYRVRDILTSLSPRPPKLKTPTGN